MAIVQRRSLLMCSAFAAVLACSMGTATATATTGTAELVLDRYDVTAAFFSDHAIRIELAAPAVVPCLAAVRSAKALDLQPDLGLQDKAEAVAARPSRFLFTEAGQSIADWGRWRS